MTEKEENKWTKREDVKQALSRFLTKDGYPEAIVLSGNWGVGKTFLWRQIVSEAKEYARPNYMYVSLFGVTNLDDLKYKLFEAKQSWPADNQTSADQADKPPQNSAWVKVKDKINQYTGSDKSILGKLAALKDLPVASRVEPLVRSLVFNTVSDAVVCLDDFERRGEGLRPLDVLGLASYLRESRNCKVILIQNEDALETQKEEFRKLEEKVFDWRVVLNPNPEHSITCIVPPSNEHIESWLSFADSLEVNNIRIIRRTYEQVLIIGEYFPEAHEEITKQFITSLLLFNFSKFGNLDHIPSLEHIRQLGHIYLDEEEGSEAQLWKQTMSKLNWLATDEVDMELMEIVENGFVSRDGLQDEVDRKTRYLEDASARQEIEAAWDFYHGSFQHNEEELGSAVFNAVYKHLAVTSPMVVDASIRLLRDLGQDAEATEIADVFVEIHKENEKILDVESSAFGDNIEDTYLRDKLGEALRNIPVEKDLREVLERLARDKGWGASDEEFLSSVTEDEFRDFFINYDGDNLPRLLKGATTFARISNPSDRMKEISSKITSALETIAASSALNERRLKRFGIKPKVEG